MSAVINVFASIGLVAILVIIIYYIWKYIDQLNKNAQILKTRPSDAYMQSIGVKCPDYWTYIGNDQNGNYICRDDKKLMNRYNKNKNSKCVTLYTNPEGIKSKVAYFAKLDDNKSWNKMSDDEKIDFMKKNVDSSKYYSRAEWIKSCGPEVGKGVSTQAVWSGLNKYV
jgi:hypothetical protein